MEKWRKGDAKDCKLTEEPAGGDQKIVTEDCKRGGEPAEGDPNEQIVASEDCKPGEKPEIGPHRTTNSVGNHDRKTVVGDCKFTEAPAIGVWGDRKAANDCKPVEEPSADVREVATKVCEPVKEQAVERRKPQANDKPANLRKHEGGEAAGAEGKTDCRAEDSQGLGSKKLRRERKREGLRRRTRGKG